MAQFGKGICPLCGRTIGGRYLGLPGLSSFGDKIELSGHKSGSRPCNGGRKVVPVIAAEQQLRRA